MLCGDPRPVLTRLTAEDTPGNAGRWALPIPSLDVHRIALGKFSLGLPGPFPTPCCQRGEIRRMPKASSH